MVGSVTSRTFLKRTGEDQYEGHYQNLKYRVTLQPDRERPKWVVEIHNYLRARVAHHHIEVDTLRAAERAIVSLHKMYD